MLYEYRRHDGRIDLRGLYSLLGVTFLSLCPVVSFLDGMLKVPVSAPGGPKVAPPRGLEWDPKRALTILVSLKPTI
jgi:hypothetical protein